MVRKKTFVWAVLFAVASQISAPFVAFADERQSRYDYFFLEATRQRQKGNFSGAFDLLQHCLEINPKAPEAYYYLGMLYSSMKRQEMAEKCYKNAVEMAPNSDTFVEALAQFYITNNNFSDAIPAYEAIWEKDKSRTDVLELLMKLYSQVGDVDNTISALERLERIDGKSERYSMAKCDVYIQKGDRKAAIEEMRSLALQYPNDMNYRVILGDMYLIDSQKSKALELYNEVLKAEPANIQAMMSLRAYYKDVADTLNAEQMTVKILTGKHSDAETQVYVMRQEIAESERAGGDSTKVLAYFEMIMNRPSFDVDVALFYASYMELKKMPKDRIVPVLERIIAVAPDNSAARLRLISYVWEEEQFDKVIGLCQPARLYNPDEMAFYYYQGIAYYKNGENDKALEAFQNGVSVITAQSNPDIVSDFYAVMGDILHEKGLIKQAYVAYDSCLIWKADNVAGMNNYAYFLSIDGGDLKKAEQMSYKTVRAEPKNATYLDTYAWILFLEKRYSEACIYMEETLKNDTLPSGIVLEHAGDIYAMNGEIDKALDYWRQSLALDEGNKNLIRKIKLKKYVEK